MGDHIPGMFKRCAGMKESVEIDDIVSSSAHQRFSRASTSDLRGLLRVLTLRLVQCRLRFGRRLLAPLAISFSGGLLVPALGLAAALLRLEFRSGPSGVPLADLGRRSLRRLRDGEAIAYNSLPAAKGGRPTRSCFILLAVQ